MELGIRGRRALVMGASRGLGKGIARQLAAEGVDLVLCARNAEALGALAEELKAAHGVKVAVKPLDLGDTASVDAFIADLVAEGGVDILLNNAGGPPPSGALGIPRDSWRRQFETMVLGVLTLTDALVPLMRARRWGRVVTIASSGVVQPIATLAMSNTLRASLVAYSKTLSTEVAADGVTANVILPGRIDTERVGELDAAAAGRQSLPVEEVRKNSAAAIPMRRYGTVEEFAAVATFLMSQPAAYVTGSVVRVDGGAIVSI